MTLDGMIVLWYIWSGSILLQLKEYQPPDKLDGRDAFVYSLKFVIAWPVYIRFGDQK